MGRLLLIVLLGCQLLACQLFPGQLAKHDNASKFIIPFEKYTLPNGLTVILHQDKSDPVVAITTLVHVGSSREKPGHRS